MTRFVSGKRFISILAPFFLSFLLQIFSDRLPHREAGRDQSELLGKSSHFPRPNPEPKTNVSIDLGAQTLSLGKDDINLSVSKSSRIPIQNALRNFRVRRRRVDYDPERFIQDLCRKYISVSTELYQTLDSVPSQEEWQPYSRDKPEEILDRMAAIDILEAIAADSADRVEAEEARATLTALVHRSLPRAASRGVRQIMLAESYDALAALARVDLGAAVVTFRLLPSPTQQRVLAPALKAALLETGVPRSHVDQVLLQRLSQPR